MCASSSWRTHFEAYGNKYTLYAVQIGCSPGPLSGPHSCPDRSKCRAMDLPITVRDLAAMVAPCESHRADVAEEIGPDKHDHHPAGEPVGVVVLAFRGRGMQ